MEKLFKHSFKRLLETTHLSNLVVRLPHKHHMMINLDMIILNSEIPNLFKLELFRIKPFPRIQAHFNIRSYNDRLLTILITARDT